MIRRIFLLTVVSLLLNSVYFAQSDYEKMQDFKKQYNRLEDEIKNASSLNECNFISDAINELRDNFENDKALLDKALYPNDFETSLIKLENALEVRRKDFTQITDLTARVDTLQIRVTMLSQRNDSLISQIKELNMRAEKNEATIASLQRLLSQLRVNINKRDQLVRDLVDTLLASFIKSPEEMSKTEKQAIASKVKSQNLFVNIERTINDNIRFINVTMVTPEDLSQMKKQYSEFRKAWNRIGPKLTAVYLSSKEKKSQIANIDTLFNSWNKRIDDEMWAQMNNLFRNKNIMLPKFNNGNEFVSSVNFYVDKEIKNYGIEDKEESENNFRLFSDSVYYKAIRAEWIPVLLDNNMMSEAQKNDIENKIDQWRNVVEPGGIPEWAYVIGAVIIIAVVVMGLTMKRKNKHVSSTAHQPTP